MTNNLSNQLAAAMKAREMRLFENNPFKAALFLDPRFQVLLSSEEKKSAKEYLLKLWFKMSSFLPTEASVTQTEKIRSSPEKEVENLMEKALREKEDELAATKSTSLIEKQIEHSLDSFEHVERIDKDADILAWWESAKLSRPLLYQLAVVVLAMPATQVSVERSFSSLKFVLSPYRSSIRASVLEDILLVRANSLFNKNN
jgi:bifunctional polynucleotide phosphatase/kinase